jgi:hypothetical protein
MKKQLLLLDAAMECHIFVHLLVRSAFSAGTLLGSPLNALWNTQGKTAAKFLNKLANKGFRFKSDEQENAIQA